MTIPVLDLFNFENDSADGCEYVLTSPRSLQACSALDIRPVELLKVTLNELVAEKPELSIREAKEFLTRINEERDEKLQEARVARKRIIDGQPAKRRNEEPNKPSKIQKFTSEPAVRSQPPKPKNMIKSSSSPHVRPPAKLTPLGLSMTKIPSLGSSASSVASSARRRSDHDRLMNAMIRRYHEKKKEAKNSREKYHQWEQDRLKSEREKIKAQRNTQARVARNRRADIHQFTEMSERKRQEEEVILKERERAIEEKLQKAYAKAQLMKEQKQQRIKENMDMEMKKKRYQEERLKMMENDKIARERQLKIELDKKLRDADAVRNQKLQSDAVVLQRRNHIKFLAFQETYEDVKKIQEEENAEKKKRLSERLEQAQKNNQELMQKRSYALKIAAAQKQRQVEEVRNAKDELLREQQARIQEEVLRNEKLAEEARRGVSQMKQMKLEEIKEKHQLERLRARENLRRNEHAFEAEREKLEQQVGQKIAKSEKILEDRERTILISKVHARKQAAERDAIRKELESFDQKVSTVNMLAAVVHRRDKII